jgi:hypothetical protein
MATGTWHYQQAEWLLEQSSSPAATPGRRALEADAHPDVIAAAQAHATLALAAQNVPPPVIVHVEGDVKPEQLRRLINEANRTAVQRHPGPAQ